MDFDTLVSSYCWCSSYSMAIVGGVLYCTVFNFLQREKQTTYNTY